MWRAVGGRPAIWPMAGKGCRSVEGKKKKGPDQNEEEEGCRAALLTHSFYLEKQIFPDVKNNIFEI